MTISKHMILPIAAFTLALLAPVGIAQYQQGQPPQQAQDRAPTPPPPAESTQVTDEQLELYVEAEHQEEAQAIQLEAQQVMTAAVQEVGIGVQTYNQINNALQTNQDIRSRVEELRAEL